MNGTNSQSPLAPPSRPAFRYADELAVVTHLVDELECRLAGRHEHRVLRIIPSDHCHLGVLGPRDPLVVQPEPLDLVDDQVEVPEPTGNRVRVGHRPRVNSSQEADEPAEPAFGEAEQLAAEQHAAGRDSTRRPPSSLGFEIMIQPDVAEGEIEITVAARFCVYTQHFPTFEEQRDELGRQMADGAPDGHQGRERRAAPAVLIANGRASGVNHTAQVPARPQRPVSLLEVFVRREVEIPPIQVRIDSSRGAQRLHDGGVVQHALDEVLDAACQDPSIWRALNGNAMVPVNALASRETFAQYLRATATGPVLRPPLRARLDVRVNPLQDGLVRVRCYLCNDTPRDQIQRFRDQHNILADCQMSGALRHGSLSPVELLPVPRDYQFDREVWAVGHGASVVVSDDRRSVRTESLARYQQPRRTTRQQPAARFEDLVRDPFGTLEAIRQAMVSYAEDWQLRVIERNALGKTADELAVCRADLAAFRDEEARFASGIAALVRDERLRRAFDGMNRVFLRTSAGRYDKWHLFQLVFVVTQLPSLAIREGITQGHWPEGVSRSWADALEWADVLWFPTGGGKTEAYLGLISCAALYDRLRGKRFGMTAWLRFPLRMLSVQQLQRAAVVIWETEQERRNILGGDSLHSDPISLGYFVGRGSTPNQLRVDDVGEWTFSRLESDPALRDRLLLVSNCPACREQGIGTVRIEPDRTQLRIRHICSRCNTELPIYVSDDEIYRFVPTVIVGTIDKMASIAYTAKFPTLWGGATWRCPENPQHGYGMGDWCVSGCPTNPRSGGRPRQRTIVATYDPAPSLHIQDELHLLQQELGAFAGHYETLVRSCEAAVGGRPPKTVAATATIEGFGHQIRHIYGLGRARRFPTRGYEVLETFYTAADRDADDPANPVKTARLYVAFRPPHLHAADAASLCALLLHQELIRLYERPHEATAWLPNCRAEEEVRQLLYYYGTTLTYVGSKARGVRIRQTLEREAGRLRPGNVRDLATEFLSGDSSLATIAATVRRIEAASEDWTDEGYLDATVATNVISHGVDVERFNLMVMDSIPEETADYIQASSRSGRRHVGLVLAVLPSYSLRSSSIYHRFKEYHQHLERLVSPVPVNRFAKYAARRTAPGVMVGLLLGRYGAIAQTTRLTQRNLAAELLTPTSRSNLSIRVTPEEFRTAVEAAYALRQGIYPAGLEFSMIEALREQIDRFLFQIRGSHQEKVIDAVQPKPMMSLRDVDLLVRFRLEENANYEETQWFNTQLP